MKKHDRLFIVVISLSAAMLTLVMAENIQAGLKAHAVVATPAPEIAAPAAQDTLDPARTEEIRKKFENQGLKLHEGKYWKEAK